MLRDEDMSERAEGGPSRSVHGNGDDQPGDRRVRAVQRVFHQSRRVGLFASSALRGRVSRRRGRVENVIGPRYRFALNNPFTSGSRQSDGRWFRPHDTSGIDKTPSVHSKREPKPYGLRLKRIKTRNIVV